MGDKFKPGRRNSDRFAKKRAAKRRRALEAARPKRGN